MVILPYRSVRRQGVSVRPMDYSSVGTEVDGEGTTRIGCCPSYVPHCIKPGHCANCCLLDFTLQFNAEANVPSCVSDINSLSSSYVEILYQPTITSLVSTRMATGSGVLGLGNVWVKQIWIIKPTFGDYHIIPSDAVSSTTFTSSASLVTRSQLTDVSETAIATTTAASVADQKSNSLSTGAIVGISFGAVVLSSSCFWVSR
jgi:hypothetical protein